MRADIFQNTIALVNQGFYITESGRKIVLDNDRMLSGTKFYSKQFDVCDIPAINGRTTIEVVDTDCMLEGIRLLDEGYRPAVLKGERTYSAHCISLPPPQKTTASGYLNSNTPWTGTSEASTPLRSQYSEKRNAMASV